FGTLYGAAARPVLGVPLTLLSSVLVYSGALQFAMVALLGALPRGRDVRRRRRQPGAAARGGTHHRAHAAGGGPHPLRGVAGGHAGGRAGRRAHRGGGRGGRHLPGALHRARRDGGDASLLRAARGGRRAPHRRGGGVAARAADAGAGDRGPAGGPAGARAVSALTLLVIALITDASRAIAVVLARIPAAIFASLAVATLLGEGGALPAPPVLGAAAGALLASPARALL